MKKLFITALFALLMGGFTLTANAQPNSKLGTQGNQESKYQTLINDYQNAVTKFVTDFDTWKEGISADKINLKQDMKTANDLHDRIEKINDKLTDSQKKTFKEVTDQLESAIKKYEDFLKKKEG